ncbi:MAG: TonB-dependent receptor plug domain-containing protein [Alphaproteobacteria bacterium]|nr:TonB-dependent receptor plug domain-containing protein [Alphaproteobacteria bacterium]
MRIAFRGASSAALLVGLAGGVLPAWGQQAQQTVQIAPADASGPQEAAAPAAVDQTRPVAPAAAQADSDKVVITGSLIQGTPEDTALPVEVFSQAEMEDQGSPTALEFAKNLTISGPTTGESYYFGGSAPGIVSYNLRGLGADKTLTLLNGRRVSENASNIPMAALARTEVLKDGAAVTYGADATGGVVNFITRDHFVGLEAKASYKYVDGSDGDYNASLLAGVGDDRVNFMISAEYEHRSRLNTLDRDFTYDSLDPTKPGYNPAPWSTLTNLAGWVTRGALPAVPDATANGEWGSPLGLVSDFTPASCAAVGGRYDNAYTCAYNYIPYYRLVENNDIYRAYAQLNATVNDRMDVHVEASYGEVSTPQVMGSPSQPIVRGPALATGLTYQFYVPITNPYAAEFATMHGLTGVSGFTPVTYRMLAHGGNAYLANGDGFGVPDKIDNQTWRVSAGVKGSFGDWAGFLKDTNYDFAVTYNQAISSNTHADVIGYRLEEALNGFGGPGCNAADLDPTRFGTQNPAAAGQGNCHWWNPFSTSFAKQPVLGLSNPNYVVGDENTAELTRWMFDPRANDTIAHNLTIDLVFNGKLPFELPGGQVAWALGGQGRMSESRQDNPDPIYNGTIECAWPHGTTSANGAGSANLEANPLPPSDPNYRGCTPDAPGPFVLFATSPSNYSDRQQQSVFGELQIPVFDRLNLQAAVRREDFSGGLGATVYKFAGKWDVWGPLSVRGSYGTNYQTPPVGVIPGTVTNSARTYSVAANNWLGAQFITDSSLKPETAKSWNVGVIWQSRGIAVSHDFRVIVDYFDIRTKDEIGQIADPNQIASLVFNGAGGTITTCDPNVQPLLNRITFNSGCTVGMSGVGSFSSVSTLYGNGPGQTTNGYDIQVNYSLPLGPGDLALDLTATKVTELKTGPTSLDGVVVSSGDDRLGYLNFATVAAAAPEWRANFSANYKMARHNFRLGVNYVSAVTDERPGIQYGENGEDWITADFTYRYELSDSFSLTGTVANIFDRDPPPAQEEFGYDPRMGNPLGRTFEVGLKKTF